MSMFPEDDDLLPVMGGYPDMDPGPAFEHEPGMMGPPPMAGTFDADMARPLTPMGPASLVGSFDPTDPDIGGGPREPALVGDDFVEGLAEERGISLEPRMLDEDSYYGQMTGGFDRPPAINMEPQLEGCYSDDYRSRPSLLNEPLPGNMVPNAAEELPPMYHGSALERRFPGHNDSMPEGAVGYVGRREEYGWGHTGGPTMYPGEIVDREFIESREADPDWSPPDVFDGPEMDERLHFGGRTPW